MLRFLAAGLLVSALFVSSAQASATTPHAIAKAPDFVRAKLNEFESCIQKQEIRVVPAIPPPDTRMELCGANFMWPRRDDLAFVRKCLARNKVISVERMPSFRGKGEEGFDVIYDCTTPYLYLNVNVEILGQSARVFGVGQAMP